MNFEELVKRRYACRNYTQRMIEIEKIEQILEAGRLAPTAANTQCISVMVIYETEKVKEVVNTYGAPVIFVLCANKELEWKREFDKKEFGDIDSSIVATHMMLMATELGLDSVWISYFEPKKLCKLFEIPNNYEVTNILAIGYGDKSDKEIKKHLQTRKPMSEFVLVNNIKKGNCDE